ncbi:putative Metallo-dependent phosphatase [Seiridium cardinale]
MTTVVTDLTVSFSAPTESLPTCAQDPGGWHRLDKDLYLHQAEQHAWLRFVRASEADLTAGDLVVTQIAVSELQPSNDIHGSWESRPGGIWVLRRHYSGDIRQAVTNVDVLFGIDAVDPRPHWSLMESPLQLNAEPNVPVARLSIRKGKGKGKAKPDLPQPSLKVRTGGKFKVVQISDTHMVTGVGVCKDAIGAHGELLPELKADPLTVKFVGDILDAEEPDLVVLTGDQVHHDIPDSQSAIFKVIAPVIERGIPYAAVFGNHDDEGEYALSRAEQMSLLQDLPLSLCRPGLDQVDGVGNYYIQVVEDSPAERPLLTLYLLDSHGQIPSKVKNPDYEPIKQSQIDWFTNTSKTLRRAREENPNSSRHHLSLAFMHIPLPEYAENDIVIRGGRRGEPTEGPSFNSHFYDALVKEDVVALGCGHDHVNDFCGLLPRRGYEDSQPDPDATSRSGPWLCYCGGTGFGGYCSYGKNRYHRRARVWEFDASVGELRTWKRVEYSIERIDETVLVDNGMAVKLPGHTGSGTHDLGAQIDL